MSKILIKFATRGRPEFFRRAISNIYATVSDVSSITILVSIDEDDKSMQVDPILNFMNAHEDILYHLANNASKIEAINRDMDVVKDWDILVNMSDDMYFVKFGWDNLIRQRMKDNFPEGDCFLHFDDGYVHDALSTMSIMDRKYYNRDGYIYHPSYRSFSCDAEAFFVAVARGRHKYFDEILATHQHPTNTPRKNDETYSVNSLHTPHDTANYWERLHNDFGMKEEGIVGPYPWDKWKTK